MQGAFVTIVTRDRRAENFKGHIKYFSRNLGILYTKVKKVIGKEIEFTVTMSVTVIMKLNIKNSISKLKIALNL